MPGLMPGLMLEQYVDLLSGCATAGAQAAGDAVLLLQCYLIGLAALVAAFLVACVALFGAPYVEASESAMRQRLWERIVTDSAARAAREATREGTRE